MNGTRKWEVSQWRAEALFPSGESGTHSLVLEPRQKEYCVSVVIPPKYIQRGKVITIKSLCLVRGSCRHQPTSVSLA